MYFWDNQISSKGFKSFCQNSCFFENLKIIDFNKNNIGRAGFEVFCQYAVNLKKLESISMKANAIGKGFMSFS